MKKALVTGGARGIGRAVSTHLLEREWEVGIHYHSSEPSAEELSSQSNVHLFQADLRELDEVESLVENVTSRMSGIDLLVNNAAIFSPSSLSELDRKDWNEHMSLNARAPLFLVRGLHGVLASRGGAVVNILDWAIQAPYADYLPYFASKGALATLTRGLARAMAPDVRVNGVAPGPIDLPEGADPDYEQTLLDQTPLNRMGDREEVARAVYFMGVEATFTTGSILEVDGGRHVD